MPVFGSDAIVQISDFAQAIVLVTGGYLFYCRCAKKVDKIRNLENLSLIHI